MRDHPPKDDFMEDKAVEDALNALFDAIDAARARRNLPKVRAGAVVVASPDSTDVTRYGCECIPCQVSQITTLAGAFGMRVSDVSLNTVADAARAVH